MVLSAKFFTEKWLIIVAPWVNTLSGILVDLQAPSLPAIANDFKISLWLAKSTISAALLGFALGQIVFGVLADLYGRKRTLIFGLICFFVLSILASLSTNIWQLVILRFFQGLVTASASITARAMLVDVFVGKKLAISVNYVTLGWGLSAVVAPIIGSYLQYHFNWQANFYYYAAYSALLLTLVLLSVHETLVHTARFEFTTIVRHLKQIMESKRFILLALLQGTSFSLLLVYSILGPFLIQKQLEDSVVFYGYTALLYGACYLGSALFNRLLLSRLTSKKIIEIGLSIFILAGSSAFVIAYGVPLTLFSAMVPVILVGLGTGLVYPNIAAICMSMFPRQAGVATAIQSSIILLISGLTVAVISIFNGKEMGTLSWTYGALILIALILYGLSNATFSWARA